MTDQERKKRPRDANKLAKSIVEAATADSHLAETREQRNAERKRSAKDSASSKPAAFPKR